MGLTPAVLHNPLTKVVCNKTVLSPPEQVEAWEEEIYSRWLYYQCAVAVIAVLTLFLTVGGKCGHASTCCPDCKDSRGPFHVTSCLKFLLSCYKTSLTGLIYMH